MKKRACGWKIDSEKLEHLSGFMSLYNEGTDYGGQIFGFPAALLLCGITGNRASGGRKRNAQYEYGQDYHQAETLIP